MIPDWLFVDDDGRDVSREELIERMRNHIHTVVSRYKGRIQYWDVVNEAVDTRMVVDKRLPLDEEGNPQKKQVAFMRETKWLKIIGDDFIELAFRFAHEADPDAKLIYNDYGMNDKAKALFVARMIRDLKNKKVPIHGVGMQGHWHLEYPTPGELQESIRILAETGVMIHISELDLKVLPRARGYAGADVETRLKLKAELNPYVDGIPAEVLQQQADRYKEIFQVLLENSKYIERVTFWGVSDKYSWLNDHPVNGRTAYPLLFDRNFEPKPAYFALEELGHVR
jgi:endo-1,4-beta-xylanase